MKKSIIILFLIIFGGLLFMSCTKDSSKIAKVKKVPKVNNLKYEKIFDKTATDFTVIVFLVSSKDTLNSRKLTNTFYQNLKKHGLSQTIGNGSRRSYYFISKSDIPDLKGINNIDKIDHKLYKSKHIAFVQKYPNNNPLKQQELFKKK